LTAGKVKVIPNGVLPWVGVKDVAKAHVLGYENPKAEGRYILLERGLHFFDLAALLHKLFPQYTVVARFQFQQRITQAHYVFPLW
jgi:cinnamoyl-CoA reductase